MRSRERVVIDLPLGRQSIATVGMVGWWWMANCHVGVMFISGLIGEWSMVTAKLRHGGGHGCGRMGALRG
jgi:hypothetical protein